MLTRSVPARSKTVCPCLACGRRRRNALSQSRSQASSGEKQTVRGVAAFVPVGVAELLEVALELGVVVGRHLDAGEDAPVIRAVIAVMEQADVPVRTHRVEKAGQSTGALRELEAQQPLVGQSAGAAAHHVANVQLGHFVVGEVLDRVALRAQLGHETVLLGAALAEFQTHEDMGFSSVAVSVVELGDVAPADGRTELAETARTLG